MTAMKTIIKNTQKKLWESAVCHRRNVRQQNVCTVQLINININNNIFKIHFVFKKWPTEDFKQVFCCSVFI